jgi:putative transposase
MAGKRDKPEEIVAKLRQVEVLQGQGQSISDAVRQIGVTQQTYYRWRKQYGGMGRAQLRRLKELEKENLRLRRAVSLTYSFPLFRVTQLSYTTLRLGSFNSCPVVRL